MLGLSFVGVLLSALTLLFVIKDRAFAKTIRIRFHIATAVFFILSIISAIESQNEAFHIYVVLINLLCALNAMNYYYCVIKAYKRDALTKLLLRNNLNIDMDDLAGKAYNIVLIDVDNFKLINDKYGHDKGDETLVTIANTVNEHLPKGCRLYRFGGDEFVVISKKAGMDELASVFEDINTELAKVDLRISAGIVEHKPNEDGKEALVEADKRMYENKKLLKSEDIWDDMTGLFNYRGFIDELDGFRKAVNNDGHCICLVAVDVDRLNNINMAYGYTEGNLAIKTLSRIIKSSLKGRDFIGHLGSDEFAVAIECENREDNRVITFIDEVSDGLGSAYEFANKDYSLKINIGRCFIASDDTISSEELVNNVLYIKQTDKEDRRKTDLGGDDSEYDDQEEKQVMDILDNNKFKYAFQPIVSAKNGDIVAYESLMRSDTDTMISPLKILKYAEKNKRLYDIERYTFFNVLSKVSEANFIPEGRRIFINSIPGCLLNELDHDLFKNKYSKQLSNVVVEITEQREINDEMLATLNARRDKDGFNLAIDDYGSGCSNTNSLLRYMPQVVKLDRLLITGIDRNAKKQFFVNSIISFARENDMQILAEGVETESELKTVIRLGVDMVQGFFTAKPSFEVLEAIPDDIKKIIIDENLKVGGNQRMVYTVSNNCELSVVHLAMEDYSKINVSAEYLTLVGNTEYTADMVVRIKDGVKCQLTLSDVCLNSVDDEPCIEIGEGAELTLNLEGKNKLNAKGIHVPENSSLTVIGSGDLEIFAKGHECYAIGTDSESALGKIKFKNSGILNINIDGEICAGIGGGIATENSEIAIQAGGYKINVAGVEAVGIGYFKGKLPLMIKDCDIQCDFRVNRGIVLGAFEGELDVNIRNFNINIEGSGTEVCGIGSINEINGNITAASGSYRIKLNGQKLFLMGCKAGSVNIELVHVKNDVMGEGDNVVGFGSLDMLSHLTTDNCSLELVINASSPLGFGTVEKDPGFRGNLAVARINGELLEIGKE